MITDTGNGLPSPSSLLCGPRREAPRSSPTGNLDHGWPHEAEPSEQVPFSPLYNLRPSFRSSPLHGTRQAPRELGNGSVREIPVVVEQPTQPRPLRGDCRRSVTDARKTERSEDIRDVLRVEHGERRSLRVPFKVRNVRAAAVGVVPEPFPLRLFGHHAAPVPPPERGQHEEAMVFHRARHGFPIKARELRKVGDGDAALSAG